MDQIVDLPQEFLQTLPSNALCESALALASRTLPRPIFNHSLRVYLLAHWLAEKEGGDAHSKLDRSLLFVACICHDLGASDLYNGEQRFEVEGADAASKHCADHGVASQDCHRVWTACALHTSAGIAERIDPFTRLVRVAVKLDFSSATRDAYNAHDTAAAMESALPRLEIEKVLANAVVSQARKIPDRIDSHTWPDSEKHPKASWPGILLRAHAENPEYDGVNPAF